MAEKNEELQTAIKEQNILAAILNVFGGAASALTIFLAIVSSAGLLVLRANANLLGISSFLHHSVGDYIYEGGIFFLNTFVWAFPAALFGNVSGWILGGLILVLILGKNLNLFPNLREKWNTKYNNLKKPWLQWLLVLIILGGCIYQILPSIYAKDLLFAYSDNVEEQSMIEKEIQIRATQESSDHLSTDYERAILYILLSSLLLLSIINMRQNKIKKSQRDRDAHEFLFSIGKKILYLLFVIELILLPIKFGQVVYSNEFHQIGSLVLNNEIKEKTGAAEDSTNQISLENQWLIKENPDSYVIYSGKKQELIIFQKSQVLSISIKGRKNIFKNL